MYQQFGFISSNKLVKTLNGEKHTFLVTNSIMLNKRHKNDRVEKMPDSRPVVALGMKLHGIPPTFTSR